MALVRGSLRQVGYADLTATQNIQNEPHSSSISGTPDAVQGTQDLSRSPASLRVVSDLYAHVIHSQWQPFQALLTSLVMLNGVALRHLPNPLFLYNCGEVPIASLDEVCFFVRQRNVLLSCLFDIRKHLSPDLCLEFFQIQGAVTDGLKRLNDSPNCANCSCRQVTMRF